MGTDAISGFNPATRPGKDKSIEDGMLEMKAFRFKQGDCYPVPSLEEKEHRSLPMKLYVDSARNLPSDAPVWLRVRASIVKGLVRGLTGVHVIYSKYLLLSTYNKILQEEERKRDRG